MSWRQGTKVKLNVYDGDMPICQCHSEDDARRIVDAMNRSVTKEKFAWFQGALDAMDQLIKSRDSLPVYVSKEHLRLRLEAFKEARRKELGI